MYNVHSLVHLPDDVRRIGHLDSVSAFPFENFMRRWKSSVRKPQQILQQLANRMSEGYFHVSSTVVEQFGVKKEHTLGPVVAGLVHYKQYRELHTREYYLNSTYGNNCIAFDEKIALVANICCNGPEICLIVQCFKQKKCFFKQPLSSTDVGIFKLWRLSKHFEICRLPQIRCKYVLLPYNGDKWIGMPLIHSYS